MALPLPSAPAHNPGPVSASTSTPASTSAQASAGAMTAEDYVRTRRLIEEVEDRAKVLRYSYRRNTERVVVAMSRDTAEFQAWKGRVANTLHELYQQGRITTRLLTESIRDLNRARVPPLFETIAFVISKTNMYPTTLRTPVRRHAAPWAGAAQTPPPAQTPPNSASTSDSGDYSDGRSDSASLEDYAHYGTGVSSTDYEHFLSGSDDDSVELSFVGPVTVADTPPVNATSAPAPAPVFFGPPLPPSMAAARDAAAPAAAAPATGGIDPELAALATIVQLQGQAPIYQGPLADYARVWDPLFYAPPMQPPVFPFRYNSAPEDVDFDENMTDDKNENEKEKKDEKNNTN